MQLKEALEVISKDILQRLAEGVETWGEILGVSAEELDDIDKAWRDFDELNAYAEGSYESLLKFLLQEGWHPLGVLLKVIQAEEYANLLWAALEEEDHS